MFGGNELVAKRFGFVIGFDQKVTKGGAADN
jgi:hypothetical protein